VSGCIFVYVYACVPVVVSVRMDDSVSTVNSKWNNPKKRNKTNNAFVLSMCLLLERKKERKGLRVCVYACVCVLVSVRMDDAVTHCSALQHAATHCSTLQHTATRCNTLQHAVTLGNTLPHPATHYNTLQHTATHCNTLKHTATHCNTLQHTATHCNTLPHTAICVTPEGTF